MNEYNDMELLDAYANRRSEEAFRDLVARHVDFIYSAALRQLRDPHLAQEATQTAFIALAGKAGRLPRRTIVAGWLYRAVHFAGLNLQRGEARRKHWEEEAAIMHHPAGEPESGHDEDALGQVDAALAELNAADRDALILRFLRQLSLRDVANELGTSEEAAKKRVSRAVEKLRGLLGRRGVAIPAATLATGLAQLPSTAAPSSLPATLSALTANAAPPLAPAGTGFTLLTSVKAKLVLTAGLIVAGGVALFLWRQWAQTSAPVATPPAAALPAASTMKIKLASVMVDDQDKALKFYTEILGFQKKRDFPAGDGRWVTVVSPEEPDGTELLLEPMGFAPARVFQAALLKAGIPLTSFQVEDVARQYDRMNRLGVVFAQKPTKAGPTTIAMLEDTCGNLLQIFQVPGPKRSGAASAPKIKLRSVMVDDQEKALRFYTAILGFAKKQDKPAGGGRWLTVVSPEEPDGTELSLEPIMGFAAAITYQAALHKAGIPWTTLQVQNVPREHARLTQLAVKFTMQPTELGPTTVAVFDDTCGNLIQIIAPK